mmetsp:Transcript_33390/g.66210  ORF Transcript_33390/g.66210 Transcript_33390/m.66210 type:complete len:252 (+) Transcript_33390:1453-2208(+)
MARERADVLEVVQVPDHNICVLRPREEDVPHDLHARDEPDVSREDMNAVLLYPCPDLPLLSLGAPPPPSTSSRGRERGVHAPALHLDQALGLLRERQRASVTSSSTRRHRGRSTGSDLEPRLHHPQHARVCRVKLFVEHRVTPGSPSTSSPSLCVSVGGTQGSILCVGVRIGLPCGTFCLTPFCRVIRCAGCSPRRLRSLPLSPVPHASEGHPAASARLPLLSSSGGGVCVCVSLGGSGPYCQLDVVGERC